MDKTDFNVSFPCNINRRSAKAISNKLSNFNSDIYISKEDGYRKYNAKSSLGLLSLELSENDNVNVEVLGEQTEINNIKNVFQLEN